MIEAETNLKQILLVSFLRLHELDSIYLGPSFFLSFFFSFFCFFHAGSDAVCHPLNFRVLRFLLMTDSPIRTKFTSLLLNPRYLSYFMSSLNYSVQKVCQNKLSNAGRHLKCHLELSALGNQRDSKESFVLV